MGGSRRRRRRKRGILIQPRSLHEDDEGEKGEEGKLEEPLHTQRFLVLGRFAVSFNMGILTRKLNEQRRI